MKRLLPWVIVALAYLVPLLAYFAVQRDVALQEAERGWGCGIPAVGLMLLACIASGSLSLFATVFRAFTLGWWRNVALSAASIEVTALGLPLLGAVSFALYLFSL